jgi:hypothetical protein
VQGLIAVDFKELFLRTRTIVRVLFFTHLC